MRDSRTYNEPVKSPLSYPTLNDIPLGGWQDSNTDGVYKPATIQAPTSPASVSSRASDQSSTHPSTSELSNLRLALEKLWSLDSNRLNPGLDYELHLHNTKTGVDSQQKLFRYVNESRILKIPTYKFFYDLLEEYSRTVQEREANNECASFAASFLKAFSQTKPGQYLHQYLVAKRLCSGDPITFTKMLNALWFQTEPHPGRLESCAFERVFLGEIYNNSIFGFHNWLYFYHEEKAGNCKYQGFVPPRQSHPLQQPDGSEHLMPLKYTWRDCLQPHESSFIGTSPEFEFALYTLCFLTGQDRVTASLSGFETDTVIEIYEYKNERRLASGYPSIK